MRAVAVLGMSPWISGLASNVPSARGTVKGGMPIVFEQQQVEERC